MELGMIGLGRMGANMARRLMRGGHKVTVFGRKPASVKELQAEGATGAASLDDLTARLARPRVAWIMVPAGEPTEGIVQALGHAFDADDIIVDGGNSYFKDDVRRAKTLEAKGIQYVDVGTSGGVWGLDRGYCLMIGGPERAVKRLDPIFRTLAPAPGRFHVRLAGTTTRVPPTQATSTAVRRVRGTTSRWCTTGSNTV